MHRENLRTRLERAIDRLNRLSGMAQSLREQQSLTADQVAELRGRVAYLEGELQAVQEQLRRRSRGRSGSRKRNSPTR